VREVAAEVKILADAGVKAFAVLSFTYKSANEVVDIDYVRVRKPDGSVIKTPDYNVQEMPAEVTRTAPMYSDVREKHVAVKGLGIGDVLEYKIRLRTAKPEIPGRFWYEHSFRKDQIVRDERVELSIPQGKHLTVKSPEFKPEVKAEGGKKIYIWRYSNLEREVEEQAATRNRTTPPPIIQLTTFDTWEEIGGWYSDLQREQILVTSAIEAKAKELTKGLLSDDAKLQAIYAFVSLHIHYVGLDFGIGRFQPHSAEDVLGNEYGDCKDKHTLLAALLKAVGFDAWPALVHASQKLDPDVPSPAQFNHVITVVPRGDALVWLDTTPEVAPYGLILPQLRDKQVLVLPTGKVPALMTTPANPPFPQEQRFNAVGKLGPDGVLKGHIVQRYRGDTEVVVRAALRQLSQSQWQEAVQRFSYSIGFAGEVSDVVISPIDDLSQPLEISYDYLRKDYSDWEHKQILALLPPLGIETAGNKSEKAPKEPIFLGAPGDLLYRSQIELPPRSSLKAAKDRDIVEPYAEYHTRNLFLEGVLTTTRRLVIKKPEVQIAEWESYRTIAKAASDDAFTYLPLSGLEDGASGINADLKEIDRKFNEASEALQHQDASRAKELLEQVIAAEPKYRWAHYNLGVALGRQGQSSQALEQFRMEEVIAPEDARAFQAAADFAMFLHRKEEAIQEYRKLLKVDPKNRDAALRLGNLLSSDGKYAEAAEALETAVQLSPDSPSLQLSLGEAYINGGKVEKALPYLRASAAAAQQAQPIDYMQLNNIAFTLAGQNVELNLAKECAEKALAALDARSSSPGLDSATHLNLTREFNLLWDTAGWVYFKLGDFERAESYVRAAWLLGQEGDVGEHLGEIYEKLGKAKEAAHTYELAITAMDSRPHSFPGGPPIRSLSKSDQEAEKRAQARYQELTGKSLDKGYSISRSPKGYSISRLPNGQRPMSPAEELSRMREAKLGTQPEPNGSAQFEVVFVQGKPLATTFLSGNEAMKSVTNRLAQAKFQMEFPVDSKATLLRRVTVVCSKYSPCSAVMMPLEGASLPVRQ